MYYLNIVSQKTESLCVSRKLHVSGEQVTAHMILSFPLVIADQQQRGILCSRPVSDYLLQSNRLTAFAGDWTAVSFHETSGPRHSRKLYKYSCECSIMLSSQLDIERKHVPQKGPGLPAPKCKPSTRVLHNFLNTAYTSSCTSSFNRAETGGTMCGLLAAAVQHIFQCLMTTCCLSKGESMPVPEHSLVLRGMYHIPKYISKICYSQFSILQLYLCVHYDSFVLRLLASIVSKW